VPIDLPEDEDRDDSPTHECSQDEVLDYRLFLDRQDEVTLNDEVTAYLASPQGQFEVWYAERERRRGARTSRAVPSPRGGRPHGSHVHGPVAGRTPGVSRDSPSAPRANSRDSPR
jgi:hypothetical protein